MVCVFPQPVAPYAKTVALYPSNTLSSRGFVVASYTSPCVVVSSNTRSNAKVWSFTRFPMGPVVDLVKRCTGLSSGGSKMLGAGQLLCIATNAGAVLQALLIQDLDDRLDAFRAQLRCRRRSQGTVTQKQCVVVAFGQLRCFSNGKWANSHCDGDGGRAIDDHGSAAKGGLRRLVVTRRGLWQFKMQRLQAKVCRCGSWC
jgi:hypothetical protein